MMKRNTRAMMAGVAVVVVLVAIILYGRYRDAQNPFDEIVFQEDTPGATERYVTFTAILRGSSGLVVGPETGADYGVLRFADWDGDGIEEAIIETDVPFWSGGEYYHASRTVLKYTRDRESGRPSLISIHQEDLGENDGT